MCEPGRKPVPGARASTHTDLPGRVPCNARSETRASTTHHRTSFKPFTRRLRGGMISRLDPSKDQVRAIVLSNGTAGTLVNAEAKRREWSTSRILLA